MPYTTLAASNNLLWKLIENYGHDPGPVFQNANVPPKILQDPNARINISSAYKIWREIVQTIGDPCIGIQMVKFWHPSYLNALGYAWLTSYTLRDALDRLTRYIHIVSERMHLELREETGGISLVLSSETHREIMPEQVDATIAIICHMCRINYGKHLNPSVVSFIHPEPACADRFFSFFDSELDFSAAENSISFTSSVVNERLSGANPYLVRVNDKVIIDYLARLEKDDITHRVKACIIGNIHSGDVTSDIVARNIGMSERSLQRRLSEKNTSFRALKEDVRRRLSLNYVRDKSIEISEIAFLLGYSEQSAFSRAFKRMTGKSPSEVRNNFQ